MSQIQSEKTVFISYSWENFEIADKIERDLKCSGIKIIRDVKLQYKDNIFDFMKQIKDQDFAVLLISDSYLNSVNCMREVLEIITNQKDFEKKILPIILPQTKLFKAEDRISLIKNWETKIKDLNVKLKSLDSLSNTGEIIKTIEDYSKIRDSIDLFTQLILQFNCKSFDELDTSNYQPLLDHIGILKDDLTSELVRVSKIQNLTERELEIDSLLLKYPNQGNLIFLKANIAYAEGKYRKAEIIFRKLCRDNEISLIHNNLAICLDELNLFDEALSEYQTAIKIDPNEASVYNNLALLQYKRYGLKKEAALNYIKSLSLNYTSSLTHSNYAKLLSEEGDYEKSLHHFEEAIKYYSSDQQESDFKLSSIHYSIARCFHLEIENPHEAIKHYKQSILLNPNANNAHCNLAVLLIKYFNDFESAQFHYNEAIKIDPNDYITLRNLGNLYNDNLKNDTLAEYYYKRSIDSKADYEEPYLGLGSLFFDKNPSKLKLIFEDALKIHPKSAKIHFEYARLLSEKFQEYEKAKVHYITAEILSGSGIEN
jgi:tetratricopeptide (TPR) repeat protein